MKKVIKRDGTQVDFCAANIQNAIDKAFQSCDYPVPSHISKQIAEEISQYSDYCLSVEQIQDIVEEKLMKSDFANVAKAYILYREKRTQERERKSETMKSFEEKIFAKKVANQNANVDEQSFGGRVGEASSVILKEYALKYCMSEKSRNNHLNNEIYIHDLDSYAIGSHNCLSIPFDKLLANGFNTRQTDVRPAGSVNTAFQLVAVIFQLQSLQQFGGVSATHLDWTMVPYVRKSFWKYYNDGLRYCENKDFTLEDIREYQGDDTLSKDIPISGLYCCIGDTDLEKCYPKAYQYAMDMTEKEVHQAAEGLFHNLNTLQSRSGN